MRYFVDTEFNGFGGEMIAIALTPESGGEELYLAYPDADLARMEIDPWVAAHVLPVIDTPIAKSTRLSRSRWALRLFAYLKEDPDPVFEVDWPDDIRYLMQAFIIEPGQMINVPAFGCRLHALKAYPTDLPNAVQHNALWDARALKRAVLGSAKVSDEEQLAV